MAADDESGRFLTEDEEQRLGASLRKAYSFCNPNPGREGCPDPKLIRDLAFRNKISDPKVFEQVTVHMSECSECVRDALIYVEEYRKQEK